MAMQSNFVLRQVRHQSKLDGKLSRTESGSEETRRAVEDE